MLDVKRYPRESLRDEKGMVLVVALLLIAALVLLGTTAVMMSTTDMKISANYKTGNQAFYVAEAGVEEARARLKKFNPANSIAIDDETHKDQTGWAAYIGPETKAVGKGYNSGNPMHVWVTSLQSAPPPPLDYTVKIVHQTDSAGNILYWNGSTRNTTTGRNIYLVTSYGAAAGASKTIEVEMTRVPPISVDGALYVENTLQVSGSSEIIGNLTSPECGPPKYGVATVLPNGATPPPVDFGTKPERIVGEGGSGENGIKYGATGMNISGIVEDFKDSATHKYSVTGNPTLNSSDTPGPGDGWGTPTGSPSTCSVSNIVYYNTNGGGVQISGASGCGTLLVDGPLIIHGDFSWNGIIITTGSITYMGTGNKNVTGAILSGGGVITDSIGGNAKIIYCSSAVSNATQNMPLKKLSWRDKAF